MTPTRTAFLSLVKPVRAVALPGGPTVHVRALTIVELARYREHAARLPDGPDRDVLAGALLCVYALCEPDGAAYFPTPTDEDLAFVAGLTAHQVDELAGAASAINTPDAAAAKN